MLELIHDYEQARSQLQTRISELNALLQTTLSRAERETLTSRRDTLTKERAELLEIILEMKSHLELEKEETLYETCLDPCSGICA